MGRTARQNKRVKRAQAAAQNQMMMNPMMNPMLAMNPMAAAFMNPMMAAAMGAAVPNAQGSPVGQRLQVTNGLTGDQRTQVPSLLPLLFRYKMRSRQCLPSHRAQIQMQLPVLLLLLLEMFLHKLSTEP